MDQLFNAGEDLDAELQSGPMRGKLGETTSSLTGWLSSKNRR
jgi:hypothetical protein